MAQLKVGEIKIADGQIHIGQTEFTSGGGSTPPAPREQRTRDQLPAPLLRIKGRLLITAGIGIAALGGALFMTLPLEGIARYLFGGGALIPLGVGVAVLGGIKLRMERTVGVKQAQIADERHVSLAEQVLGVVESSDGERSVEELAEGSGMSLQDTIRGLAYLQKKGRVEEKLNLETGDWYYAAVPVEQPAYGSGSLAERMAALEEPNER